MTFLFITASKANTLFIIFNKKEIGFAEEKEC